jgi:choline dehydrogenase
MTTYDYIVVGSGSAGSIIAARLSEDADVKVLLLEAGRRDDHPFMAMPIAFPKVATNPRYIWPYSTDPEPGLHGRRLPILRGRTLGGCSSINAMINVRGNRNDFDRLAQTGLQGWSYREVLPYFRKLETSWRGDSAYHGTQGPVRNVPVMLKESFYAQMEQAAMNAGLPRCDDHNAENQDGVSRIELTTNLGRRASSARAYLHPAMKTRKNLTVLTGAQATRVLLEGQRAIGVEYLRGGQLQQARAEREVVLSGGTYNSPQLLQLSGIGPANHLRSLGITVVQDLPGVGENLNEHPNLLNIYRANGQHGFSRHLRLDKAVLSVLRWALRGEGPFTTAGTSANMFLRSSAGLDRPDIQIITMAVHQHANLWFPALTAPPVFAFTARVGVLHAQSRGYVRLRTADPLQHPAICFNMFTQGNDMLRMVQAVKQSREIFAQSPMRDYIAEELLPGSAIQTDKQIEDDIRERAEHRHHAVGTCQMGVHDMAVVDAQLRVHGVENLRVADASVLPDDPSGNTNVPTLMIGERAADLLKGVSLPPADV